MTDAAPTNGIRTGIARLAEIAEVAGKISGGSLSTILLGLVFAAYFGWIQSPLTELTQGLKDHDGRVTRIADRRVETDAKLVAVLQALQNDLSKMNRVQQIRTCAEIVNHSLREMCLR